MCLVKEQETYSTTMIRSVCKQLKEEEEKEEETRLYM